MRGDAGDIRGDLGRPRGGVTDPPGHLVRRRGLLLHRSRDRGLVVVHPRDHLRDIGDGGDGGRGVPLDRLDPATDVLGGLPGLLRELLDLVGHHGEALARLAGAGRLDRGVQRQQVGLLRDRRDHLHDVADLGGGVAEASHQLVGLLGGLSGTLGDRADGSAHLLRAAGHRTCCETCPAAVDTTPAWADAALAEAVTSLDTSVSSCVTAPRAWALSLSCATRLRTPRVAVSAALPMSPISSRALMPASIVRSPLASPWVSTSPTRLSRRVMRRATP